MHWQTKKWTVAELYHKMCTADPCDRRLTVLSEGSGRTAPPFPEQMSQHPTYYFWLLPLTLSARDLLAFWSCLRLDRSSSNSSTPPARPPARLKGGPALEPAVPGCTGLTGSSLCCPWKRSWQNKRMVHGWSSSRFISVLQRGFSWLPVLLLPQWKRPWPKAKKQSRQLPHVAAGAQLVPAGKATLPTNFHPAMSPTQACESLSFH